MKNTKKILFVRLTIAIVTLLVISGVMYASQDKTGRAKTNVPIENRAYVAPKNTITTFSVSHNTLSVIFQGKVIQTLSLDKSGEYALSLNKIPPFITDEDVNFDGHNDVGVLASTGYGGVNNFYDFYILNPTTHMLEKNDVLTGVAQPRIDGMRKRIISIYKSGTRYISVIYQWTGTSYTKSGPGPATVK